MDILYISQFSIKQYITHCKILHASRMEVSDLEQLSDLNGGSMLLSEFGSVIYNVTLHDVTFNFGMGGSCFVHAWPFPGKQMDVWEILQVRENYNLYLYIYIYV